MSLIRWSPNWDPFADMQDMMQQTLPARIQQQAVAGQNAFIPAVDMYETKNDLIVETPLAGMNPEDVEVEVSNGILTIKGETKKEREVEEKNYYRKETRSGSFFRQVPLPVSVIEEKVSAEFADGVLQITCPKSGEQQSKKISVKVTTSKSNE
ncbi:MAG: molecular chaperone [Candidatus Magasanikbacteria bacterium CG10_big_fil_rev_8_21_14_0_10_43_6]|uniref:Molecular chaperone n=1 Tax=Candidatus Magasanikbacteria bacterium CG10_big_fil_rev_8_21_14_0_10_43_6 TaxID=1974650 RepID=A0A2M6VZS5_9BACT|nr:MAG: molecular chaperone [Candidatus Magasanikbacteria bacterium CG10_big_fil_rev_8_21_14_0_10_43_6]